MVAALRRFAGAAPPLCADAAAGHGNRRRFVVQSCANQRALQRRYQGGGCSRVLRANRRAGGSVFSAGGSRRLASTASGTEPWVSHAGEGALLLRFGTEIDVGLNTKTLDYMATLDSAPMPSGVREILPSYASLLVHFDPLVVSSSEVEEWCREVAASGGSGRPLAAACEPRQIEIPVCYGGEHGPDIDEAARLAGLESAEEVARIHSSGDYRVYFLGFSGGFPYLGGLPAALATVPRLNFPRQLVIKGTVGIAAGQTGVYPVSTPGGWHLLGRTAVKLFDPTQDPPAALRAGDIVKFIASDEDFVEEEEAQAEGPAHIPEMPWIEVMSPGPMTTVQDIGRHGYARHGVSRSGGADELALRMGNALLGNNDNAAGLEVALGGLKIRSVQTCGIALTGADCKAKIQRVDQDSPINVSVNEVVVLQPDDILELGYAKDGARAYVCVQGGIDVPCVLGSRSTDIRAAMGGFEGRTLRPGDEVGKLGLADGATTSQPALLRAVHDPLRSGSDGGGGGAGGGKTWQLRVLSGPGDPGTEATDVPAEELQALFDTEFDVTARSDRMAVCLSVAGSEEDGGGSKLVGGQQMSEACASGTIQLPPDGNPLILLAEHQTTGGYKVPAVVIKADLWQVGQMRPGDSLRLVPTTTEEAIDALRQLRAQAKESKPRKINSSELNIKGLRGGVNQLGWDGTAYLEMGPLNK